MPKKGYKQLTYEQRCQIYALRKRGLSSRQIGADIGVSHETVLREVRRNGGGRGYRYKQAEEKSRTRRRRSRKPRKLTKALAALVEEKLSLQWSPEQIAGWLKRQDSAVTGGPTVSHETIYRHIWRDKKEGGGLWLNLRRRARRYQRRGKDGKTLRGRILGRVDIDQRPDIVALRQRVGDWEADSVVGAKGRGGAILSLVDRKSRLTRLAKTKNRTAPSVSTALVAAIRRGGRPVKTITFDNGKEFAQHQTIAKALRADTFFAKPYHAWERGTNENTNGLIRQYFPKRMDFATITQADVRLVERLLNDRPRKCLDFQTPNQVFRQRP